MSDSLRPHRWQPTRLRRPWDSPGKSTGVGCYCLLQCLKVKSGSEVTQSCLTLSDPVDCSLPGSSVHGIFQARALEWGAIAFSSLYGRHMKRFPTSQMIRELQIKTTKRNLTYSLNSREKERSGRWSQMWPYSVLIRLGCGKLDVFYNSCTWLVEIQ